MAREVHKFIPDGPSTEGGRWKGSTNLEGTIRQILVVPQTDQNVYNFGIIDEDGMVVFREYDIKGQLNVSNLDLIMFPGEKRLLIEEATKNEPFRIKIIYQL